MKRFNELLSYDLPFEKLQGANVLITGANGLIASDFTEALLLLSEEKKLNTHIYALCRSRVKAETRFSEYLENPNFSILVQDVSEPLETGYSFDYIIHAASSAHPDAFNNTPVDVMKANFIGTMNLLDYTRDNPKTRFLYVSSSEVYGENFERRESFREEDEGIVNHARFRACYPESKRASETLAFCYQKQYGSDIVIVRPAFIYGRNIISDNTRADVYFLRQALNHEDIVMYSSGEQIRCYCYINDCVSGMIFAMLKGESGGIYNIGNQEGVVTLREYAQMVADHGGVSLIIDESAKPQNKVLLQTTKLILDTSRLEALGWKPAFTLDEGFDDIFNTKSDD